MTTTILITGKPVGHALFYARPKRQGSSKLVRTYRAQIIKGKVRLRFAVTRDTYHTVFNDGPSEECPPNFPNKPYRGWVRKDKGKGFRIQLYEPGTENRYTLKGTGDRTRTAIQIHRGPGKSIGCFMVAGGERGYDIFRRCLESLLEPEEEITIHVHER